MKKKILVILIVFLIIIQINSEDFDDLNKIIDIKVTLKDLATNQTLTNELIQSGKYVFVSGTIVSRVVINQEIEDYLAEIEIVDGEWQGFDDVFSYKSIIQLSGSDFHGRIPVRRSRREIPGEIKLNSNVIILAKIIGYKKNDSNEEIPLLQGFYLRFFN